MNTPRRVQLIMFVILFLCAIAMMASIVFTRNINVFRYLGYCLFLLLGLNFIYTGFVNRRNLQSEEDKVPWYQDRFIRLGLVFIVLVILYVCIFDVRNAFFKMIFYTNILSIHCINSSRSILLLHSVTLGRSELCTGNENK